ncbi:MAG: ATP-binding protein [Methylococcaceae bacterium]|nr:ATP-binding protein [Methylococcaceae bacterium]
MKQNTVRLEVDESKLVNNLRHAFTRRSNVISELMQNARRAGATEIRFTIKDDYLTIDDDGVGIDDFSNLLTVASSGWDAETIQKESPFGLGFLAALYACKTINIQSNGILLEASTQKILDQEMISLSHSLIRKGTSISLLDIDYKLDKLQADIESLSVGFPISIFINSREVLRPHAEDSLVGENTAMGFMHMTGIHTDVFKPNMYTKVYLQGLPIRYNGDHLPGRGDHFLTPFGHPGSSSECNVVHLDSEQFIARVPDRDVLIDSTLCEQQIVDCVAELFWNCFVTEKKQLSAEDFMKKRWDLAHSMGHRRSKFNYKSLFNDIPFVPGKIFNLVYDYPFVLRDDEEPGDFFEDWGCTNEFISKGDISSKDFIVLGLNPIYSIYEGNSSAIGYMFAQASINVLIYYMEGSYSFKFDKAHWIYDYIDIIEDPVEHFSYRFMGSHEDIIFKGTWVNEATISFVNDCESNDTKAVCEVTHIKSGQTVLINEAFVLPNGNVFYPSSELSAKVMKQLICWSDDGHWSDEELYNEQKLFNRFVLSERAKDPEALLQELLGSQDIGIYSTLKNTSFSIVIDNNGKLKVTKQA